MQGILTTIIYKLGKIDPQVYLRVMVVLSAVTGFCSSLIVPVVVEFLDRMRGRGKKTSGHERALQEDVVKLKARILDLQDALRDTENERDELRLLVDSKRAYSRDWLERADSTRRRA